MVFFPIFPWIKMIISDVALLEKNVLKLSIGFV